MMICTGFTDTRLSHLFSVLAKNRVMQKDNDPEHTNKSTSEWLKLKGIKVLPWPVKVQTSTRLKYCDGTLEEL